MRIPVIPCYLILICIPAMSPAQTKGVVFTDVTKKSGIDFTYTLGDYTYVNILESSGSGITIFDYNNDHLQDVYLMNGTYLEGISDPDGKVFRNTPDKLYKNNGNGTFTEVGRQAGLDDPNWSMAAGPVDYDNDGDQDLYLLNYGPNVFFRNNGNGTFTDITSSLGLKGPEKLNGFTKWSIGVVYWDVNQDGLLDAMVGNFLAFDPDYVSTSGPGIMPHPSEYKGQASMLYLHGTDGTFTDATREYNLYYPDSKCMGLTVFDYDDDGDLDIYQANDHQLNFLFRFDNGTFDEVAISSGVAGNSQGKVTGSMHGSIGDLDSDGYLDILIVDLEYGSLYRGLGNGLFEDFTEKSGLAGVLAGKGSWGATLFDYDNDCDLDLFVANGTAEELVLQYPLLMENDGKAHFKNVGPEKNAYFSAKRSGRGAAVWDFDNDGDLDIIVSHVDKQATATLLRNDGGNYNHWLGITLVDASGPAAAISAKIVVQAGTRRQVIVNQFTTGYLSNSDPRLHVGLGQQGQADQIEISWINGKKEIYQNVPGDRYITIIQGKGIVANK